MKLSLRALVAAACVVALVSCVVQRPATAPEGDPPPAVPAPVAEPYPPAPPPDPPFHPFPDPPSPEAARAGAAAYEAGTEPPEDADATHAFYALCDAHRDEIHEAAMRERAAIRADEGARLIWERSHCTVGVVDRTLPPSMITRDPDTGVLYAQDEHMLQPTTVCLDAGAPPPKHTVSPAERLLVRRALWCGMANEFGGHR